MRWPWLAALPLLAVACDSPEEPPPVPLERLATSELSLRVELRSNGALALIVVTVFHELDAVALSGEDQLFFGPTSDPSHELTHFISERTEAPKDPSEPGEEPRSSYVGELATGDTDFALILARSGGERLVSTFTLPAPFALSAPAGPASRSALIPITWDMGSGAYDTRLAIDSPCLRWRLERRFEFDPAAYNVQLADLFLADGAMDCNLQVTVTRSSDAAVFAAGLGPPKDPAALEQVRVASFATVP